MPNGKCRGDVKNQAIRHKARVIENKTHYCECCDLVCIYLKDIIRHKKTIKHIKNFIKY